MKASEAMTREVCIVRPDQTIREAARLMRDVDTGALPVGDGVRLLGMITDRDIAVRGVAQGKSTNTAVRDVMSEEVFYCFDDEDLEHIASNMGEAQLRRLPVVDREKRLVGINSIADIARCEGSGAAIGEAVCGVSRTGGDHSQTSARASA